MGSDDPAATKALVLVAGISSPWLVEEALRLHGSRLGSCVVIDGWMDVLALKDELAPHRPSTVYLVFPGEPLEETFMGRYEPGDSKEVPPSELVKRIWMNLTGTLDPDHYIEAFRLLGGYPFEAYKVGPDRFYKLVERLCQASPPPA